MCGCVYILICVFTFGVILSRYLKTWMTLSFSNYFAFIYAICCLPLCLYMIHKFKKNFFFAVFCFLFFCVICVICVFCNAIIIFFFLLFMWFLTDARVSKIADLYRNFKLYIFSLAFFYFILFFFHYCFVRCIWWMRSF